MRREESAESDPTFDVMANQIEEKIRAIKKPGKPVDGLGWIQTHEDYRRN